MIDLDEIQALTEAATDGPWLWVDYDGTNLVGKGGKLVINGMAHGLIGKADAAFIAAVRTAVPELVAEIERLRKMRSARFGRGE